MHLINMKQKKNKLKDNIIPIKNATVEEVLKKMLSTPPPQNKKTAKRKSQK